MQTLFQIQLQFMIGAILLLLCRPLLNRFPKIVSYSLWCILFLRLLCPFSLPVNSALWSMQGINEIAEREAWQDTRGDGEIVDGDVAEGTRQTGVGDTAEGTGQTGAGNTTEGTSQNGVGDTTEGTGQAGAGNTAEGTGQTGAGNTAEGTGQIGAGNTAEGTSQTGAGNTAEGTGQAGAGNTAEGTGQAGAENVTDRNGQNETGTKRLHETGNGTDGMRQAETEDGNVIQKVAGYIGFAVKKTLAVLYHWLDMHRILFAGVWAAGMVLYLVYTLYAIYKYRHYVNGAKACPDRQCVYESDQIASPFVFGVLHKKIILPQGLSDTERKYILCHEEMHIRRNDHLVKGIVFLLTGIYWFQPLVWIAAYYLEQDMEMSCDEMVIRNMGEGIKKAYAQSLLSFAEGRRPEMLPLAFASGGVKWRIRNVLRPRRFRKWMVPVTVILALSFVLLLFTEQRGRADQNDQKIPADLQQTGAISSVGTSDTSASETDPAAVANASTEKMNSDDVEDDGVTDHSEDETVNRAKNAVEKNFGNFFDSDDSNHDYETYFINRYKQYRIEDLSQWKDKKGQWCYPKKYEFSFVPSSKSTMASQQFPPELLEDMDTEELLSFILKGQKEIGWGWMFYDNYLMGLSMYYQQYNYVHDLMNRKDCARIVHQCYSRYSEQEIKKYSKRYPGNEESQERINFQLVEGLEWFFMAMEGKEVPDEYVYGSQLEKTLDSPAPPKEYIYHEDVTHDGVEDIITLDMTALRNESLATGEEETVTVTSGKSGQKIASYTADTVHYGWNGLYLYEDETGKYLVNWKPMMYQGVGTFQLRVFSLKENGKEDVRFEKEFHFDLNPGRIDFNQKAYQKYMDQVNDYLKNSYVIIDTDQGEVIYATEEGQLIAPYDGSWVIDEYKEMKNQEKKGKN